MAITLITNLRIIPQSKLHPVPLFTTNITKIKDGNTNGGKKWSVRIIGLKRLEITRIYLFFINECSTTDFPRG
jgi:hypothetical protein